MADEWDTLTEPPPGRALPAHVTTPLLTRITEQAMDEDYRQVALRKDGRERPSSGRPRIAAAAMVVVFGLLVTTAAVQTSRNADVESASRATLIQRIQDARADFARQQQHIAALQDRTIALQDRSDDAVAAEQEADARLTRLQVRTGFAPVHGPGVRAVVDDAPGGDPTQLVRDEDLAKLVDGLWSAGAEAVSINGQRLTALTAIRNRGPAVRVNSQPVNPPYTVLAIGDPRTLQSKFSETTHGSEFDTLARDLGFVFDMDNVDDVSLPGAPEPHLRNVRELRADAEKAKEANP